MPGSYDNRVQLTARVSQEAYAVLKAQADLRNITLTRLQCLIMEQAGFEGNVAAILQDEGHVYPPVQRKRFAVKKAVAAPRVAIPKAAVINRDPARKLDHYVPQSRGSNKAVPPPGGWARTQREQNDLLRQAVLATV